MYLVGLHQEYFLSPSDSISLETNSLIISLVPEINKKKNVFNFLAIVNSFLARGNLLSSADMLCKQFGPRSGVQD